MSAVVSEDATDIVGDGGAFDTPLNADTGGGDAIVSEDDSGRLNLPESAATSPRKPASR